MEEKLNGIVIGGVNYGENDKILNLFTLEKGQITAKIKGVKKSGAKLKFAAEPFCFAEYVFSVKGENRTVIGASLIDSFYPLREDLVKCFSSGVILEFIRRFVKEGILSVQIFTLSIDCLKKIAYEKVDGIKVLVYYLMVALKLTGYALNTDGCSACGKQIEGKVYFDYNSGGFYCEGCMPPGAREINYATLSALQDIMQDKEVDRASSVMALRLLDFYINNKAEEKLTSLKELLKITAQE